VTPNEKFLTVAEAAEWLRVPQSWVYAHADELGVVRVGKYLRFVRERILTHLQAGASSLDPPPNDPDGKLA